VSRFGCKAEILLDIRLGYNSVRRNVENAFASFVAIELGFIPLGNLDGLFKATIGTSDLNRAFSG